MQHGEIREITSPIAMEIAGDRLHVTVISGEKVQTYSVSFNKARGASHVAMRLLARANANKVVSLGVPPI